ncbi:MAG: hypothetical protein PHU46_00790 [Rhodocyclaceae bacterium]|nr:hypothetical protein [Rhodocyclaceae bacterium]
MDKTPASMPLATRFTLPLGRQEIELSETDFEAGGMNMLRVRIREGKRFTIFDVDPVSAATWGKAMQEWAETALARENGRQAAKAQE